VPNGWGSTAPLISSRCCPGCAGPADAPEWAGRGRCDLSILGASADVGLEEILIACSGILTSNSLIGHRSHLGDGAPASSRRGLKWPRPRHVAPSPPSSLSFVHRATSSLPLAEGRLSGALNARRPAQGFFFSCAGQGETKRNLSPVNNAPSGRSPRKCFLRPKLTTANRRLSLICVELGCVAIGQIQPGGSQEGGMVLSRNVSGLTRPGQHPYRGSLYMGSAKF